MKTDRHLTPAQWLPKPDSRWAPQATKPLRGTRSPIEAEISLLAGREEKGSQWEGWDEWDESDVWGTWRGSGDPETKSAGQDGAKGWCDRDSCENSEFDVSASLIELMANAPNLLVRKERIRAWRVGRDCGQTPLPARSRA